MDVVVFFFRHTTKFDMPFVCMGGVVVFVGVVFGLDDDSPASRKDAVMEIELIRFEEVATKYWYDSQVLSIRKMHDGWRRGHVCFPCTLPIKYE